MSRSAESLSSCLTKTATLTSSVEPTSRISSRSLLANGERLLKPAMYTMNVHFAAIDASRVDCADPTVGRDPAQGR